VEQALGVLQSRWTIVWYLARIWSHDTMWEVMNACSPC
jgi:hypothetical protein